MMSCEVWFRSRVWCHVGMMMSWHCFDWIPELLWSKNIIKKVVSFWKKSRKIHIFRKKSKFGSSASIVWFGFAWCTIELSRARSNCQHQHTKRAVSNGRSEGKLSKPGRRSQALSEIDVIIISPFYPEQPVSQHETCLLLGECVY